LMARREQVFRRAIIGLACGIKYYQRFILVKKTM
jgi:hypothetical protein